MQFKLIKDEELVFSVLSEVLAFMSAEGCLLVGLKRFGVSQRVVLLCWAWLQGFLDDHWVSGSLEGVMYAPYAPLDVFVVLVCTACIAFSCSFSFLGSPPFPPLFL